jgi:hypothetical protein
MNISVYLMLFMAPSLLVIEIPAVTNSYKARYVLSY